LGDAGNALTTKLALTPENCRKSPSASENDAKGPRWTEPDDWVPPENDVGADPDWLLAPIRLMLQLLKVKPPEAPPVAKASQPVTVANDELPFGVSHRGGRT